MKWKIGNIEIKNQLVLAPMAGISNTSYRKIIKGMGAGLIYAEMVSTNAIAYGNEKTFNLLKMSEEERPIVQQIFGSDIKTFVAAAKLIEEKMLQPQEENENIYEIMLEIGKKRGCIISGGKVDEEKTARLLLDEFKNGMIGKITIESIK